MRILKSAVACLLFGFVTVSAKATCVQDQYGNQYNFTIDTGRGYVYGTVASAQCSGTQPWDLIGTAVAAAEGTSLSLSAANPNADGCIFQYTLKGIYPTFQWYYQDGSDNPQPSTYVACGTQVAKGIAGKGALK